jgi:hypothetical protein
MGHPAVPQEESNCLRADLGEDVHMLGRVIW